MAKDTDALLTEILESLRALDNRVAELESRSGSHELKSERANGSGSKKTSIKEFLLDRAPKNAVQMTLAIGYYLENYEKTLPFTAAELEVGFRAAKETIPPNINDKINMCVRNGHLMEEKEKKGNKKAWVVTRSGEQQVQAGFASKM